MPKMSTTFNAKAAQERVLVPEGTFPATILSTDVRAGGNSADEEIVVVQFSVFDGSSEDGRTVFEWFRLNSPSTAVREIAEKNFVQLLDAVGIDELDDTDELHGKELTVRVTIQTSNGYPPRNRYAFAPIVAPKAA